VPFVLKDELRDDDDSKSDLIDEREKERGRENIVFVILGMRHKASSTECND